MKKLLFAIIAIALSALSAQAQETSFGLKAGMTGANEKAKGSGLTITTSTKIGFYAGAFAEIGVSENFAVQPELFYSSMGGKINMSFGGQTVSATDNLGYINLPILAKYRRDGFSAFLGPQIGYLISAKSKSDGETTDEKSSLKSAEVAGVIGAGYTLMNGFGFDARYQMGLSNVSKDTNGESSVKNNAFMVGVHYKFNH